VSRELNNEMSSLAPHRLNINSFNHNQITQAERLARWNEGGGGAWTGVTLTRGEGSELDQLAGSVYSRAIVVDVDQM
jgi:hypothetical protein